MAMAEVRVVLNAAFQKVTLVIDVEISSWLSFDEL
jgi:hypothetical protein